MMHRNQKVCAALLSALLATAIVMPAQVMADDTKEAKQAARRIAQIRQQLETEKTQLQTEKTALEEKATKSEQENDALKSNLAIAQRKKTSLVTELENLRKEKDDLQQKAEANQRETQERLDTTLAKLAALEAEQRTNDTQRKELSAKLTKRAANLASCEDKNSKMYDVTLDLIKTCDQPSAFEKIMRSEPFTQIKRVGLESNLEEMRDKVEAQKLLTLGQ